MILNQKPKVNLFIIGQPKTGTTSLYYYLKNHPKIFTPKQKQLYHFAFDFNEFRKKNKLLNRSYYKEYYNYSFESYISKFNFDEGHEIYTDITPDYMYSEDAAENIYKYNPNAKVIAIIREPLSFLKSFHLQLVNSGKEYEKNFLKAMSLQKNRKHKRVKQDLYTPDIFFNYSKLIDYKYFLNKYHFLFKNNFKIIIYDDFKENNIKTLNNIMEFLGIEKLKIDKIVRENQSFRKSLNLHTIKKLYFMRIISSRIPLQFKKYLKGILNSSINEKFSKNNADSLKNDTIFKKQFKDKIVELKKYIDKNDLLLFDNEVDLLKKWKYD